MCASYLSRAVWRNAGLTLAAILLWKGAQLVLFYCVALSYGPGPFGSFALAFGLLYVAAALASMGSATYGVRALAAREAESGDLLSSLLAFQLSGSVVVFCLGAGAVFALTDIREALLITLVLAQLVPGRVIAVAQTSFHGRQEFVPMALFAAGIAAATVLLGVAIVSLGASAPFLASFLLGLTAASACVYWLVHRRLVCALVPRWQTADIRKLMLNSAPYFLLAVFAAIHMKADILMIRVMRDPIQVGYYGVAAAVTNAACLAIQALLRSLFPAVAQSAATGPGFSPRQALRTLLVPLAMGTGIAVVITALAGPAVSRLLGETYSASVAPLRILAWFLPPIFVSATALRVIAAAGRPRTALRIVVTNCCVNIAANWVLIPRAGICGAAAATVLSACIGALQGAWTFAHWRPEGRSAAATLTTDEDAPDGLFP